jgi:C-terminal processing protease CtpA/Prc
VKYTEITNHKFQNTNKAKRRVLNLCFLILGICSCFGALDLRFSWASSPATVPSAQIASWFADLNNRDADVRERARTNLMGISRADLDELQQVVEKSRPIAPSQAMVLQEIVEQVVQATQPYPQLPDRVGFLGVRLPREIITVGRDPSDPQNQAGALVTDRIPGFCAYGALQNGDMIVAVGEAPNQVIRTNDDLTAIIGARKAGETVHLEILRNGKQLEVPITLSARPVWAGPTSSQEVVDEAVQNRQRIAHDYWEQHFAPLLGESVL